jgi:hypothetical protein
MRSMYASNYGGAKSDAIKETRVCPAIERHSLDRNAPGRSPVKSQSTKHGTYLSCGLSPLWCGLIRQ